jgi:hypothetical protein
MLFNDNQFILLKKMLKTINSFQKGELKYFDFVYNLEGLLDIGEFEDENFIKQWYDHWTPLEILYATKGNSVVIENANKYIVDMESFLKSVLFA